MAETIKIGGRLHSTETGNVVAGANEIYDDAKGKKQSVINAENDIQLASHESRLNAYTEGKFVTVSNYFALPATGAVDTVYRVSSWDGTANNGQGAVDVTKYSEYAWQNGAYKFLDVKTQIGEVFDISEYNSGAVYTDLANALGNNGINVPSFIRRGGMSVKFKQVITPATYTVVKTEGATEQPTGTELQSDPGIISGTYTAGELSVFSTLPATLNSSLTYYLSVTETVDEQEVTTYTTWVITYVHTSDNKYVQYRLMADGFTTDTTQWAICDNSVLVECPEYVAVYTDADGKIILAVENNGNIHFGAGVPQQVIDYINEKIAELSLDEYEYIVTFLGTLINGDKTLAELLDEKVDKVEGKSLIDEDVANGASYVENPEFINVELDADGNIIKATKNDGTEYFGVGIDIAGVSVEYSVENPEYIGVFLTGNNRILMAFENDGNVYYGIGVPKQIKDYVDSEIGSLNGDIIAIQTFLAGIDTTTLLGYLNDTYGELVDSPEFMEVELDANKKILGGRKSDGTKFEEVGYETPNISIDGINLITVDDPENRMDLGLDNGKKIVYYRDEAGVLHENVGVETNSLRLTSEGMTEFQQALKNSGFRPGGAGDWSDYVSQDGDYPLNIPIPKCAMLNIISDFDLTDIHKVGKPGAIEGVNYDIPTQVEFYDMSGNYFKKWATMSAQGNSSYAFMKKNLAFDFYDTEANGDAFAFKFGNWVAQDSYHLKAYYTDGFRGINIVNYTLYEQIMNTRSADENREFKKHIPHIDTFSDGTESEEYNSVLNNYDAEARCFPDGFPVVVYQNGVFWGIFAWQLKKHRKNYHLDKKTATHIHLDGNIAGGNLFLVDGKATAIGWDATSDAGFEVRNPKADSKPSKSYLFLQADGSCYDADLNAGELLGKYLNDAEGYPDPEQPNPYYDNSNKNHKVCNNVKNNILKLSTYIPELKQMENDSATAEQIKARFEQMFDVNNLIDYIAFSAFIGNTDGFAKNWQWVTWDGDIWTVNPYDCDLTYGSNEGRGHILSGPGTDAIQKSKNKDNPCGWIWAYYPIELKARYKYLRDSGILSSDNVINILNTWISRFNIGDWEREFEKWSETPAHRPSYLNTEYWEFVRSAYGQSATYNENTSYNVGDEVVWMGHNLYDNRIACRYRCVKAHTAYDDPEHDIKKSDFYPCYKQYNNWPQIMGHYDSPSRVKYWIDQTLATQVDAEFNYI